MKVPVFHHANLKTTRLDEMIAWYATTVALEVVFRWSGGAFLSNDEANHRVALSTSKAISEDVQKLAHAGMHHLAFEYAALDDLLSTYVRLAEGDIRPHFTVDHGMTTSFYYLDPDGNSVELQVDNFGDWARSTDFMRTAGEFAADPVGVLVDPEQMLHARSEGATPEDIHERGYAGEFLPPGVQDLRIPF